MNTYRVSCWRATFRSLLTLVVIMIVGACSGDGSEPQGARDDDPSFAKTQYEIRFFAGTGAETKALSVGPDPALWLVGATGGERTMSLRTTSLPETATEVLAPSMLIRAALLECELEAEKIASEEFPASEPTTFFYIKTLLEAPSCDRYLRAEQVLACAADKLGELAESVGPIVWQVPRARVAGLTEGPYAFPPQETSARFIIRDAALHTLAHISWLDMAPMAGAETGVTCTDLFAKAAGSPGQVDLTNVLGIALGGKPNPALPGLADKGPLQNNADIRELASSYLKLKAHVLRAAARMLPDLVTDSVYGDLGGATRRRSAQGDFGRGMKVLWGNADDGYYNSYAHAARVLGLRWQLPASALPPGQSLPTARCGTWSASKSALEEVYGDDYNARVGSLPAITNEQSDAIARLEGTGVVFDSKAIKLPAEELKTAVVEQLLFAEAHSRGVDVNDFRDTPAAGLLSSTFDSISDADFLFAAKTVQDRFRVLTNADTTGWESSLTATENMPSESLSQSNPVGMRVFRRPLPKEDLTVGIHAKLGGLQTVAQCTESVPGMMATGADYSANFAMQDSFAMGQMLYSRLVAIRELTGAVPEAMDVAEAASAEARAWGGQGRMFAVSRSLIAPRAIELTTLGFEPRDFDAADASEMGNRLLLVWGTPQIAQCASGQATACPEDIESFIARPINADVRSLWPSGNATVPVPNGTWTMTERPAGDARRFYGVDGTWGKIQFNVAEAGANFKPTYSGKATPRKRLYVVLTTDPASTSGAGRVLGAITLRARNQLTGMVVSNQQWTLYNSVFGISRSGLFDLNVTGSRSLAEADAYCLPGVPFNVFVPLESELTSDGDGYESSWRSLLAQARASSSRADDLGDKMLDWGLQKELRREDANGKLAGICGTYGLVDETTFPGGNVTADAADGPLKSCLDGDEKDIVFLGKEPDALSSLPMPQDEEEVTRILKAEVLGCPEAGAGVVGNTSGLCDKPILNYGALALDDLPSYPSGEITCPETDTLAQNLPFGFPDTTLRSIATAKWRDTDRLEGLVSSLKYSEEIPDGSNQKEWFVQYNDVVTIMSSTGWPKGGTVNDPSAATIWPGCQLHATCPTNATSLQRKLMKLFGTTGITTARLLREDLAWRVQGALWTLAAMSTTGTVPQRMFTVELPVAAFNEGQAQTRLVPAIYGNGLMDPNGWFSPDNEVYTEWAKTALGNAAEYPQGYFYPATNTPSMYPPWLSHFWSEVTDANDEASRAYLTVSSESDELSLGGRKKLGPEIADMADAFAGMKCGGNLYRTPNYVPVGAPEAGRALLETIKTTPRQTWLPICRRPGHTGKRGTLVLDQTAGEVSVAFRDVILAGKCNEDSYAYGYSGELMAPGSYYPMDRHWWYAALGNACADRDHNNISMTESCLNSRTAHRWGDECWPNMDGTKYEIQGEFAFGPWDLRPDNCTKGKRARMFVNSHGPTTPCDAAGELVAALGLACELQNAPPPTDLSNPPTITSLDQLSALGAWLQYAGEQLADQASRLYVENVPTAVLIDYQAGTVGTGNNAGSVGQTRLEMGENLEAIRAHWRHVGETIALIGTDIRNAQVSKKMAENDMDQANIDIAIKRAESLARMAEAIAAVHGETFSAKTLITPGQAAVAAWVAGIEAARHAYVSSKLGDLKALVEDQYENSEAKILNDLQATLITRMSDLGDSITGLRTAVSDAKQNGSELDSLASQAQYEAAVASGESFYKDANGNVVEIPVNTILNRQFDVTRNRYRKALTEARYLAFLTRVAIEQRIGERLDATSFPTSTGPLESPGLWADDVCTMTGIDFEKYKDAPLPEWAKEQPSSTTTDLIPLIPEVLKPQFRRNLLALFVQEGVIDDLSKQYIGDYVARLETFVTYYNTEYPSHDGDDTTVLSLRDDLMTRDHLCSEPSPNLLYFSGELGRSAPSADESDTDTVLGWRLTSCDYQTEKCLRTIDLGEGDAGASPPVPGAAVSWLAEEPPKFDNPHQGIPSDSEDEGLPRRTVTQQLRLAPGTYVLSWWDAARAPIGDGEGEVVIKAPGHRVRSTATVLVTDEQGESLGAWQDLPSWGWSARRFFGFEVKQDGFVSVSISISLPGEPLGSVAFAGMQLEKSSSVDSAPSPHVENGATIARLSQACPLTSEDVRNAFDLLSDENGRAYFELRQPISIGTDELSDPTYLNGKLAQGNFNYRHVELALNLVGTGLVDCTGQPATCRDTNTVDYTLAHDAYAIQLRGVAGLERFFNFGEAFINDGRALASEIEVETPVTAEYGGLLHQDGVTKTEYMGRPLDGVYRLRIWDRPGLQWGRLKDVQLVLKYRYWSAINKGSNGPN